MIATVIQIESRRLQPGKPRANGSERSWDWLFADGDCPICGRRHSRWIRRVAAWLGGEAA